MSYIVDRKDRYPVVADDGRDPLSGEERRLWHPVGLARLTHVEFPLAFAPAARPTHTPSTKPTAVPFTTMSSSTSNAHAAGPGGHAIGSERELRVGVEVVDIGG